MSEEQVQDTTESTAETQEQQTTDESTQQQEETPESKPKSLLSEASEEGGEESESKAPTEYDFKLPEGVEMDKELLDTAVPMFKEAGLSQESAQKFVDMYTSQLQKAGESIQEQQTEAWNKQISEWQDESKKYFGADLKENLGYSAKFMDKFGDPELREVLDQTGMGNHPLLIKLFARAGKVISDDSFVDAETNTSASEEMDLKKIYPTMQDK